MIFGGNLFDAKLKFGRYDAIHGAVFLGDGKGGFQSLTSTQSGFSLRGEIKRMESSEDYLLVYVKDGGIHLYKRHLSKE